MTVRCSIKQSDEYDANDARKKHFFSNEVVMENYKYSCIDEELFKRSLSNYEQNHFVQWLVGIVGEEQTREAIERYFVGTSENGGTVFWQIDLLNKVRTGKIIVYDNDGCRRTDVMPPVQWVHSILKLPYFNLAVLSEKHNRYQETILARIDTLNMKEDAKFSRKTFFRNKFRQVPREKCSYSIEQLIKEAFDKRNPQ